MQIPQWFKCVRASTNQKTGPIPITYTDSSSCPPTCPFNNGGCYAGLGPINWIWKHVDMGVRAVRFKGLIEFIKSIPLKQLWRHDVAGDLPGKGIEINGGQLKQIVEANKGRRGFTYTHKPVLNSRRIDKKVIQANRRFIKHANKNGFVVNLSANNLAEADKMVELGIGPVVAVMTSDTTVKTTRTPGGNKVQICPHYYTNIQCANCNICSNAGRKVIIGFPAHGTMKKTVDKIVEKGAA